MLKASKEHLLFVLVIADFALAMLTIFAEVALHWTLPRPLQDQLTPQWSDLPLLPWWMLMVALTVTSWIGLLCFWKYARALYASAWGVWLLLIVASGPSVMTSVGAVLTTLESLVGGAILALVYFTELGAKFEDSEEENLEATQHSAPSTQH